jgi:hypothetical protein
MASGPARMNSAHSRATAVATAGLVLSATLYFAASGSNSVDAHSL